MRECIAFQPPRAARLGAPRCLLKQRKPLIHAQHITFALHGDDPRTWMQTQTLACPALFSRHTSRASCLLPRTSYTPKASLRHVPTVPIPHTHTSLTNHACFITQHTNRPHPPPIHTLARAFTRSWGNTQCRKGFVWRRTATPAIDGEVYPACVLVAKAILPLLIRARGASFAQNPKTGEAVHSPILPRTFRVYLFPPLAIGWLLILWRGTSVCWYRPGQRRAGGR